VGKPVGYVRSVLRLAKLPAWALAAVDAGTLPRATAELVARVPGEASRERAAACVLLSLISPADLPADRSTWVAWCEGDARGGSRITNENPLSYRDTKALLRNHFTAELKGAPFDRKSLDLLPQAGSCEACPNRAGNNDEAKAEGTRADVCLDPDCFRAKVEAHDERERSKAIRNGAQMPPEDFAWPTSGDMPPRGYCRLHVVPAATELAPEFAGHKRQTEKLFDLLAISKVALDAGPPVYAALDAKHKLTLVMRTAEARKHLLRLEVLKRPEPRKSAEKVAAAHPEARGKPAKAAGPSQGDVDEKAAELAASVLREYTEDQCSALDGHEDAHEDGPIRGALELACRTLCYDGVAQNAAPKLFLRRLGATYQNKDETVDAAICAMKPSQMVALLVEWGATMELQMAGPNRPTGESLLAWAELDWPALREQARRELAGGEPAEAKIARAESAPAPETLTDSVTVDIVRCEKCKATYDATGRDRCPSCGRDTAPQPEQPPEPVAAEPVVKVKVSPTALLLRDIPGFPAAAADELQRASCRTLADLGRKCTEQSAAHSDAEGRLYAALRGTVGIDATLARAAMDAVLAYPGWAAATAAPAETTTEPKPKKKAGAK
jgi:hypothetical protein